MVKAKKFIFAKNFQNLPLESDFELVEEELPAIKDGEFLAEAVYLSVDPYMRAYSHRLRKGITMIGFQVAKITQSKNKDFPVNKYVVANFGWRTHTISNGQPINPSDILHAYVVPYIDNLPLSLALGVLGLPGNSAYFGFLEICKPKPGETVVVTGAGGAVGSHVGQIAKIKGCRVIGITGTDAKCEWIKSIGFDHAINYKTENLQTALAEAAPRGIDCYFDNVGGEISSIIIQHMSEFGRISVCGSISSYNSDGQNYPKATVIQPSVVSNQLEMKGFMVWFWNNRWMEGIQQNLQWVKEGKLKYEETITEGFENTPKAFIAMLQGENRGKAVDLLSTQASADKQKSIHLVDFYGLDTNIKGEVTLWTQFLKDCEPKPKSAIEASYLRNSTGEERLNGIALMFIHSDTPVNEEDVLNQLALKPRRLDILL